MNWSGHRNCRAPFICYLPFRYQCGFPCDGLFRRDVSDGPRTIVPDISSEDRRIRHWSAASPSAFQEHFPSEDRAAYVLCTAI